ncbi:MULTISPECIES: zinc-ribbon domain-containing protein [unclassified Cryobacterium]|uniref:zinc-ribbon domain-containing protein n=1 Tax=unclassified Cryobacterium TaxID=2649013 RepID=UPI000CE3F42D|nr:MULTISPECIES: zinc-ribbon domain-containing protein [unclassified Cryobacterium]
MTDNSAGQRGILLVDSRPDLAEQFHPTLNGAVSLQKLTRGSNKKVWWLGTCGHEWDAAPSSRNIGSGCPVCAGHVIIVGFNDLATLEPLVAAEWHPTKNGDLRPAMVARRSGKKVWWLDSHGHEWLTAISGRTNGSGCPFCSGKLLLAGFNDLATRNPDLAAQWHPTRNAHLPSTVAPKSNTKAWWICSEGHEWLAQINNRSSGNGCPVCKIPRGEEFAAAKRRRRAEGRPVKHRAFDPTRVSQGLVPGHNDMLTTNPELAAEFHPTRNFPMTPETVVAGAARKFWWICSLGHEWETTGNSRASMNTGCPTCAGQRTLAGFNDLATTRPDIASEWHPTKNAGRTPKTITVSNGTKAWWLGTCGHEWEAVIASRTGQGVGCSICSGHRVLAGFNDLVTQRPDVAASWHPSKNGAVHASHVSQYSNSICWWQCELGHEWESTVSNRTHGQNCPSCSEGGGFKRALPGYVYFLEHPGFNAFKVGITNVGTKRLAQFQSVGWEILNLELFEDGAHALMVEGIIKRWWRDGLGLPMWLGPQEMPRTSGWTETVHSAEVTASECIARIKLEGSIVRSL